MTKGEMMVGINFNPSEKSSVDQVKGSTAALIDGLQTLVLNETPDGEAQRCAKIAQQKYEEACMFAVKALTR